VYLPKRLQSVLLMHCYFQRSNTRRKLLKFILTRLKRGGTVTRSRGIDERGNIILLVFSDKCDIFRDTAYNYHDMEINIRTKRMPFTAVKHSAYNGNPKLPRFHLSRTDHHFRGKESLVLLLFRAPRRRTFTGMTDVGARLPGSTIFFMLALSFAFFPA